MELVQLTYQHSISWSLVLWMWREMYGSSLSISGGPYHGGLQLLLETQTGVPTVNFSKTLLAPYFLYQIIFCQNKFISFSTSEPGMVYKYFNAKTNKIKKIDEGRK